MSLGLRFLVASLLKVVSCEEKILKLPSFDLLSVNSLIKVQVVVDADISEASLKLEAPDSALSLIRSDVWPTAFGPVLVLGRSPSSFWADPLPIELGKATLTVPKALLSIGASAGATVHADVAGGSVFSDSEGTVTVANWVGSDGNFPTSFRANSRGKTIIEGGEKVNFAYIGATSEGVVVVAAEVESSQIDASSQGQITVNSVGNARVVCSSNAMVSAYGGGDIEKISTWGCGGIKNSNTILP